MKNTYINSQLWIWAIANLLVGIWEIYAYSKRSQLTLEKRTLWDKIHLGQINLHNFWIEGWSEYCKVDSRYIIKQYVWGFELLNALLAVLFLFALGCKSYTSLKIILFISIINCLLYFITLFWEVYYFSDARSGIKENIKNYSKLWMLPTYYLISGIWLIVPMWLLLSIS